MNNILNLMENSIGLKRVNAFLYKMQSSSSEELTLMMITGTQLKIIFLIYQPKHMLWVLKRTVLTVF